MIRYIYDHNKLELVLQMGKKDQNKSSTLFETSKKSLDDKIFNMFLLFIMVNS
jgi:hypothetical protein